MTGRTPATAMGYATSRRNARLCAEQPLLLKISSPTPIEQVVRTVDISRHGARVVAPRELPHDSRGTAESLDTGRTVPCRVVWQASKPNEEGELEIGLELGLEMSTRMPLWEIPAGGEILDGNEALAPVDLPTAGPNTCPDSPNDTNEIARVIADVQANEGDQASIRLWSGLVEVMEAKGLISRDELIGVLRGIQEKAEKGSDGSRRDGIGIA